MLNTMRVLTVFTMLLAACGCIAQPIQRNAITVAVPVTAGTNVYLNNPGGAGTPLTINVVMTFTNGFIGTNYALAMSNALYQFITNGFQPVGNYALRQDTIAWTNEAPVWFGTTANDNTTNYFGLSPNVGPDTYFKPGGNSAANWIFGPIGGNYYFHGGNSDGAVTVDKDVRADAIYATNGFYLPTGNQHLVSDGFGGFAFIDALGNVTATIASDGTTTIGDFVSSQNSGTLRIASATDQNTNATFIALTNNTDGTVVGGYLGQNGSKVLIYSNGVIYGNGAGLTNVPARGYSVSAGNNITVTATVTASGTNFAVATVSNLTANALSTTNNGSFGTITVGAESVTNTASIFNVNAGTASITNGITALSLAAGSASISNTLSAATVTSGSGTVTNSLNVNALSNVAHIGFIDAPPIIASGSNVYVSCLTNEYSLTNGGGTLSTNWLSLTNGDPNLKEFVGIDVYPNGTNFLLVFPASWSNYSSTPTNSWLLSNDSRVVIAKNSNALTKVHFSVVKSP